MHALQQESAWHDSVVLFETFAAAVPAAVAAAAAATIAQLMCCLC
jgi:hypothetical protein